MARSAVLTLGGGRTLTWDAENRIRTVGTTEFTYDTFGERLKKKTGSNTSLYPFGDDYEITNGVTTRYVSVDGLGVIAKRVTTGSQSELFWLHTDRLGSIQAVTDSTGEKLHRDYRPYGETRTSTGTHTESRGWIDQRNDSETGLTYLHARYFDPKLGLFLSADPIGVEGGMNVYAYGLGNPLAFADRTGLLAEANGCDGGGGASYYVDGMLQFPALVHCPPGGLGGGGAWSFVPQHAPSAGPLVGAPTPTGPPDGDYGGHGTPVCKPGDPNCGKTDCKPGDPNCGKPDCKPGDPNCDKAACRPGAKCPEPTTCRTVARVLRGNPRTVGQQGGIPGTLVTANTAAVIPSQFGVKSGNALRPYAPYIKATVPIPYRDAGRVLFVGVTDVIGGAIPSEWQSKGYHNVREALMAENPGMMIIERVTGQSDLGTMILDIEVPPGLVCSPD